MSPLMSRSQARDRQVGRVSGNLAAPMPFNTDATGRATSDIFSTVPSRSTWTEQEKSDALGGPRRHSPPHIPTPLPFGGLGTAFAGSGGYRPVQPATPAVSSKPSGSGPPPPPPPGPNGGGGGRPSQGSQGPSAPPPTGGPPAPQPGGVGGPPGPPGGGGSGGGGGGGPQGPGGPGIPPGRRGRRGVNPPPPPGPGPPVQVPPQAPGRPQGIHFDQKIKTSDIVKAWAGKADELPDYILDMNILASQSPTIYNQLGQQVALQFTSLAKDWFNSLHADTRLDLIDNWGNMRDELIRVFLTRAWTDRTRAKATKASYRGEGNTEETPLGDCLRKSRLLRSVFDYDDSTLILEVLKEVPQEWQVYINSAHIYSWDQFMEEVNQHEHILTPLSTRRSVVTQGNLQKLWEYIKKPSNSKGRDRNYVQSHAVVPQKKYPFPRDDSTKSTPRSPGSMGKRPCRHCGSPEHWDSGCKYTAKKKAVNARVFYTSLGPDELVEEEDYDRAQQTALNDSSSEVSPEEPDNDQEGENDELDF